MKISFLINGMNAGGKERQLLYLCNSLIKYCSIQVIIFNDKIFYEEIYDLPLKLVIFNKNIRYTIGTIIQVYKALSHFNTDIIHTWDNVSHCLALPFIIARKVKVINSSIRYAGKIKRDASFKLMQNLAFRTSHVIVSNSKAGLAVENMLYSQKGKFIHNGFDLSYYDQNNEKNSNKILCKINSLKYSVIMIGRFVSAKDYITFIQAAKLVIKANPYVGFYCIGDGDTRQKAEIESVPLLSKNIFFLGERNDVLRILHAFDIGVLLNNTNGHAEGISNAIMEYMAAGLPVIATKAGGTLELVRDNLCGYLVPPFNPEIVAEKILFLLDHENERKKMGQEGVEIIKKDFSLERMSSSFLKLYRDMMNE
ncbi:MAG: glycosyltransferase [Bacteroidales bacterium]|nr:glycosyltransferase [Bacteroidales bacterium]